MILLDKGMKSIEELKTIFKRLFLLISIDVINYISFFIRLAKETYTIIFQDLAKLIVLNDGH